MRVVVFIFFLFFSVHPINAQISGIVNNYTPVVAFGCNSVDVVNASFFSTGDRALIIQMKGATIDTPNSTAFGDIINYNDCGNFEFTTISSVNGNTVVFQENLLNTYTVSGAVQLILIPQYTDVSVNGTLTAQNWNGSTGGVLVMEISGTLTLNAPISLNGKGFRGSFDCQNPDGGCGYFPDYFYPVSSGHGAEKGEGIATVPVTMNGGRGALANGGGGGNATRGGRGGDQAEFCAPQSIGGEGGKIVDYTLGCLFLGGGGGSPDHNNQVGTPGANGGGLIIIRAGTIVSNNQFIESNGLGVPPFFNNIGDGAGGGGAGGTIVLDVPTINGNLILRANGGNGGDQQTTYQACFGPGGGGGVGAILTTGPNLPANVTTEFIPGVAGIDHNPVSNCYQQSYGAEPGVAGSPLYYDFQLQESNILTTAISLGNDITTCDTSLFLDPGILGDHYLWSNGDTTPATTIEESGDYWLEVELPGTNCFARDTIHVSINGFSVNAGVDQTICNNTSITLNASGAPPGVNYSWDQGVMDGIAFVPAGTALYRVTATDPLTGCSDSDTVQLTVLPPVIVSLSVSDTSGCTPFQTIFNNTTPNALNCNWDLGNGTVINSCSDITITYSELGCFDITLNVTTIDGCEATGLFDDLICTYTPPIAGFYADPLILEPGNSVTTLINTSLGAISYEWDFGDQSLHETTFSPIHAFPENGDGSYLITLTATDENGCSSTANGIVYQEGGLIYYVPNTFTPDGDEFNNLFTPVFTAGFDPYDYTLQIYNRWGELIFESNDSHTGWDGTYSGKLVPDGAYTWQIEFKTAKTDERKIIQGHVNVLR